MQVAEPGDHGGAVGGERGDRGQDRLAAGGRVGLVDEPAADQGVSSNLRRILGGGCRRNPPETSKPPIQTINTSAMRIKVSPPPR
jgi:hypothetical protein